MTMKTLVLGVVGALAVAVAPASAEPMKVAADVGYSPHVMASPSGGVEGYNLSLIHI